MNQGYTPHLTIHHFRVQANHLALYWRNEY